MSRIKGYSIQNGEPTPDNPAEIKSLDIEKDIKFIDEMIKEYNTFGDLDNTDYEDTDRIYKAIENILKRIQKLEEENKKYIVQLTDEQYRNLVDTIKKEVKQEEFYKRQVYEELLEDK